MGINKGTAELLTTDERCHRAGFWSQSWEKNRVPPSVALDDAIRTGLTHDGEDFGEEAGDRIIEIAATRGLDSEQFDQHAEAVHLASLADIITTATRKKGDKPWKVPDPVDDWKSSCFISPDGNYLRRIVCVPNWSDERQESICRSWETLGPVALFNLPMQIATVITGNRKHGRWHSFWSHALQHPQNKKLRFRKKNDIATGFKSSWLECWRPDHDEISTQQWINAMCEDDVLQDVFFKIDYPRMDEVSRRRVMDISRRKLERIFSTKTVPDEQYTGCNWPIRCQFLGCCNRGESPSKRLGFMPLSTLRQHEVQ